MNRALDAARGARMMVASLRTVCQDRKVLKRQAVTMAAAGGALGVTMVVVAIISFPISAVAGLVGATSVAAALSVTGLVMAFLPLFPLLVFYLLRLVVSFEAFFLFGVTARDPKLAELIKVRFGQSGGPGQADSFLGQTLVVARGCTVVVAVA